MNSHNCFWSLSHPASLIFIKTFAYNVQVSYYPLSLHLREYKKKIYHLLLPLRLQSCQVQSRRHVERWQRIPYRDINIYLESVYKFNRQILQ
jgi:hypothetical protein